MNAKQKQAQKPRLARLDAVKNISYQAPTFKDRFSQQARPLDLPELGVGSFRVEGIEGDFDRICRQLGLSGPDDFAIPVAAWEARKSRSPSERFPSHRFRSRQVLQNAGVSELTEDEFESKLRVGDKIKHEHESNQLKNGLNSSKTEASVRNFGEVRHGGLREFGVRESTENGSSDGFESKVGGQLKIGISSSANVRTSDKKSDEVGHNSEELLELGITRDWVSADSSKNGGGCGIKGARPPVLAPPPAMVVSSFVVDNVSSTWDILRSFGPQDDDALSSDIGRGLISSPKKGNGAAEEVAEVVGQIEEKREGSRALLRESSMFSESCSDTFDNGDESLNMIMGPLYSISPNGNFMSGIKSWQKGGILGSGSFGTVYEGFTDDGIFFAVKEVSLLDQGSQAKQSIYQLEQEISLLSQFEHENIVRYLGTDKDDYKLYIFLELVTKGSLAKLYQTYRLGDSQVSLYTRQILNGLNYLHCKNVVHRDIKCANILVDASGSVKLADFGLAKATKLNDVTSCKGTAFWMAPEVVNGKNRGYGLAADIWSLGCTVLEMLTGQVPYSHLEGVEGFTMDGRIMKQ
ncbi:mitogen-activated protein kinase kinase kinase 1-like isoform X2 [Diospyros lotus]|uniref:mitogen-activated protein kinase kinase kinase 1-like isoform X2 n=1 Tax=Diospyros lotus TaxID=55363 RepID=UPI002252AA17|nr:mitogen-activated protein kinase kinase kinase 1-like isoform X2 [Diospyros lotus]